MSDDGAALQTRPKPAGSGGGGRGRRTRIGAAEEPPARRGPLAAIGRALPWALGAALGVAAGAYLTAVGGAGAPGADAMDLPVDLVLLPALAFGAMLAAHLVLQGAVALIRSRSRRSRPGPGGA